LEKLTEAGVILGPPGTRDEARASIQHYREKFVTSPENDKTVKVKRHKRVIEDNKKEEISSETKPRKKRIKVEILDNLDSPESPSSAHLQEENRVYAAPIYMLETITKEIQVLKDDHQALKCDMQIQARKLKDLEAAIKQLDNKIMAYVVGIIIITGNIVTDTFNYFQNRQAEENISTKQVKVKVEVQAIKEENSAFEQELEAGKSDGQDECQSKNVEDFQLKLDKDGYCIVYVDGQRYENKKGIRFGLGVWFGPENSLLVLNSNVLFYYSNAFSTHLASFKKWYLFRNLAEPLCKDCNPSVHIAITQAASLAMSVVKLAGSKLQLL
jgi:hypothetical protein